MSGLSATAGIHRDKISAVLARLDGAQRHRGSSGGSWLLSSGPHSAPMSGSLPVKPDSVRTAQTGLAVRYQGESRVRQAGQVWAGVDGFFTNHDELVRALHLPSDASGEAVVEHAYRRWGDSCFSRLQGAWSLIMCDLSRARVLAARDHTGVGQLYFAEEDGSVLLASEPRAIAAALQYGPQIEEIRFGEFLNGFPPLTQDRTFFRGVRCVPAGSVLAASPDRDGRYTVRISEFWDPRALRGWTAHPPSFSDAVALLEEALLDAVHHRIDRGRTGALLSGGLDSSVVAAMAARHVAPGQWLPTFSILHSDPQVTEEQYINSVVAHVGLKRHAYTISPEDAIQAVDTVVAIQGEPLLGQDLIGQWHAYKLAAENGVRSVFDGVGADELLAGTGTEQMYLQDLLVSGHVISLARELGELRRRQNSSLARTLRRYLVAPLRREMKRESMFRRYDWISRDIPGDPQAGRLRDDAAPDKSALNRYLYLHIRHQNAPTNLARLDRCAAAHGLTALVPFLDLRVVELCLPLPGHFKMSGTQPKRVLHEVARQYLPPDVADRKDKKAIVPGAPWMQLRSQYADLVKSVPLQRAVKESSWIDQRAAERFVADYISELHNDHLGVWRLITAWRWFEIFGLC